MIISIASGKGGTGKTTVSTNLALSLGTGVQLLDCDVEQPNAHLFISTTVDRTETVSAPVPEVDPDKCTHCGKCAEICQFNAIVLIGNTVLPFEELCHGCGGCIAVCPESAIIEKPRPLGIIRKGHSNGLTTYHGQLRVGEAMSPPLIKKVLAHADPAKVNLVDAPPGTSCPVVETMKAADFVILVTEPTPFGLHDLKLAVDVSRQLSVPCGLVVNRWDLGDCQLEAYASRENLPVLLKIPFDRGFAEAYSRGEALVTLLPEWRKKFLDLYDNIKHLVNGRQ